MIKIKFNTDHKVRQGDGKGPLYQAGKAYEFSGFSAESYARKYIARGYATEIGVPAATVDSARADQAERELQEAERRAQEAAKLAERSSVDIPEDFQSLPWSDLRALASKCTDDAVHNKAEAIAAITAEKGRRAIAA
jgi:hypothetical protein